MKNNKEKSKSFYSLDEVIKANNEMIKFSDRNSKEIKSHIIQFFNNEKKVIVKTKEIKAFRLEYSIDEMNATWEKIKK